MFTSLWTHSKVTSPRNIGDDALLEKRLTNQTVAKARQTRTEALTSQTNQTGAKARRTRTEALTRQTPNQARGLEVQGAL